MPWNGGWEVRLPLRAERITVEKQVVVAERVTIQRGTVTEVVRLNDTAAREELRVDVRGDLRDTQETAQRRVRSHK